MEEREKRNHRAGLIISLFIHGALLLLFVFLLAWSPPDPPIPEYGIELDFGFTETGSGDQESEQISDVESEIESENETESEVETEPVEEVIEEQSEEPTTESTDESVSPDYEDAASPDKVKESEETKIEKEEKTDKKKSPEKPVEKPNPLVTYPSGGGKKGEGTTNDKGNMGDPRGGDGVAYEGNPGSGGSGLKLEGWKWEKEPIPEDVNTYGKIVFDIVVDKYGTITKLEPQKYISPTDRAKFVKAIYDAKLLQKSNNPPEISKGTITFIIKRQ